MKQLYHHPNQPRTDVFVYLKYGQHLLIASSGRPCLEPNVTGSELSVIIGICCKRKDVIVMIPVLSFGSRFEPNLDRAKTSHNSSFVTLQVALRTPGFIS